MEEDFGFTSGDTDTKNKVATKCAKNGFTKGKSKEESKTKFPKSCEDQKKLREMRKEMTIKKRKKKKRLIIRNLSFKVDENELRQIFSKFGEINDLTIPKKPDGKKRGFAFVQYSDFKSTIHAIKNLNYQKIHERPIAVDYAVPKDKYEHMCSSKIVSKPVTVSTVEVDSDSDDSDQSVNAKEEVEDEILSEVDPKEKKVNQFLEEFDEGRESEIREGENPEKNAFHSSSSEDEVLTDHDDDQDTPLKTTGSNKVSRKDSNDISGGKTVFVRNISFETQEEVLKSVMEEYGSLEYCLLCIDPITEHPRGTAFVKFKNKEDAEKLISMSSDDNVEGIYLDGRRLYSSLAISREELKRKFEEGKKKCKDKRNLALLVEGQVRKNSYEAEGVSESDLAKRYQLEMKKKNKLKNLQFFVSDIRLCVHNIPPSLKDLQLRKIFKDAVGPKAKITEVRIMRNLQKLSPSGEAESKGYGFVAFSQHKDALQALRKINNNPALFTPQKRPIVEFSIENRAALQYKEHQKEKNKMNIKKNSKQLVANDSIKEDETLESDLNKNKSTKYTNKKRKRYGQKKQQINVDHLQNAPKALTVKEKKLNKKKRKTGNLSHGKMDNGSFSKLVNSYKEKIMSKFQ